MKKQVKKLLIGAGVTAAAGAGIYCAAYGVTKMLLKVALDRQLPEVKPKHHDKLTGYSHEDPMLLAAEEAGKELERCGCRDVQIQSHDGIPLVGHWYHNPNAKRIIVAMHGWRSSWLNDFGMISAFLHENECSVLYAEQRAQNNSGGEYITFGLMERYDCAQWVKWVNDQYEEALPVYLAGISMGATTVLMAAGLELPENVRGIVADCGFTSPRAIWKHVAEKNLKISYGLHDTMVERMCRQKIRMGPEEYSTLDAMAVCKVPVLFVHGTDDDFVPVTMTYENYQACAAPKELLIVPGANHGMSYGVDTAAYQKEILQFWEMYDKM